jgi:hypothetical protein
MATHFYNRTTYRSLEGRVNIPLPFLWLDQEVFEKIGVGVTHAQHRPVMMAQTVCQRMADIDYFATEIGKAQTDPNVGRACSLVATYLVAYFSASKGFLDGVAIGLNQLFQLELAAREQDFGKPKLLRTLEGKDAGVAKRYHGYGPFVAEVIAWRDSAVHRVSPLTAMYYLKSGPPKGRYISKDWAVRMHRDKTMSLGGLGDRTRLDAWVDPLELPREWRPRFVEMSGTFCEDLGAQVLAGWH